MATTTIQVSEELADELAERKRRGDTYEHVIRRLLEAERRRRDEWTERMEATREAAPDVDLPERPGGVGIDAVDIPGQGATAERRRAAVAAVCEHIKTEGSATRSELLDLIDAEELGYQDGRSAWENCLAPALRELAGVEASGSSGAWVPTEP